MYLMPIFINMDYYCTFKKSLLHLRFRIFMCFLLRTLILDMSSLCQFLSFQLVQFLSFVKYAKPIFRDLFGRCAIFGKLTNQRRNNVVSNSWIIIRMVKLFSWTFWHLTKLTIQVPSNLVLTRADDSSKSFAEINPIRSKHQS